MNKIVEALTKFFKYIEESQTQKARTIIANYKQHRIGVWE